MSNEHSAAGQDGAQAIGPDAFSSQEKAMLNELLSTTFNSVTRIEEKSLNMRFLEGLTIAEIHTIDAIGLHQTVPMKAIGSKLGVTMATVNAAVNRLERKGYVTRTRGEQDRRQMLVTLTTNGRKALRVHDAFHRKMVDRALEGLSRDEEAALVKALANVKAFFDEEYETLQ